jgi:hypothetical protein
MALAIALLLAFTVNTASAGAKPRAATTTTSTTTATTVAPATTTTGYANTKVETFSTTGWWQTWGLSALPWRTSMVTEGTSQFLRVNFPAGSHNGASFDWLTGASDSAHIRYRIRLSSNWNSGTNGVKLPGFGKPTYDSTGACSGGCGGAPADGVTSWSARGHMNAARVPGSYIYTPERTGWAFQWNTAPALVQGRWYTIDYWVKMNTPGQRNGVLRAAVNGVVVHEWTDMNFRSVDSLHVNKAWFGFYYGGAGVPAEYMWIDIDDIVIDW